ncbi:unnamed protein product [Bursaphelenchus xylophilus]|uniref:(pine wood nematode) hypothetical protein n=1 Tax=Bursaphelenchus xylophilus TaxID=6326 RepID=A0A7I8WVA4_BURXY|nr:unnamed protein product [Bursaphelenchus xylophilus]CAG9117457.1 unnamed protein product [Bursaphelenchus xylophilus]
MRISGLLLLLTTVCCGQNKCQKCTLRFECWDGSDGIEDGVIVHSEMNKFDGCARSKVSCKGANNKSVTLLKIGQYITLSEVELVCNEKGKWSPYNAETVACGVSGSTGVPLAPTCLSVTEVVYDGTETGDEKSAKVAENCKSCPTDVKCFGNDDVFVDGIIDWRISKDDATGCAILDAECGFGGEPRKGSDVAQLFVGKYSFDKKVRLKCGANGAWVPEKNNEIKCGVYRTEGTLPPKVSSQATCKLPKPIRPPGYEDLEDPLPTEPATTEPTTELTTTSSSTSLTTAPTRKLKKITLPKPSCCGSWSEWMEVTKCADTCGSCGVQRVRRKCLTDKCKCEGESEEIRHCNRQPCRLSRTSCCSPYRPQVEGSNIECGNQNTLSIAAKIQCDRPQCCPPNGIWSEWQAYGRCPVGCGGFARSKRKRICLSQWVMGCKCEGPDHDSGPCNLKPCTQVGWTKCRSGLLPMKRGYDRLCSEFVSKKEQTECCPFGGIWDQWSEWTHCKTPCGGCSTTRRWRMCASERVGCPCTGDDKEEEPCNTVTCEHGKPYCCSPLQVVIYAGNALCWLKERAVHDIIPAKHYAEFFTLTPEEYGKNLIVKTSTTKEAKGKWSDWEGYCTEECGLCGHHIRKRKCLGPGDCNGNYREELRGVCPRIACKAPHKPCCHGKPVKIAGIYVCILSK